MVGLAEQRIARIFAQEFFNGAKIAQNRHLARLPEGADKRLGFRRADTKFAQQFRVKKFVAHKGARRRDLQRG